MREQAEFNHNGKGSLRISLWYAGVEEGLQPWEVAEHHHLSRRAAVGTWHIQGLGWLVCRLRRRRRGRAASSHNRVPPSSGGIRVSDVLPD